MRDCHGGANMSAKHFPVPDDGVAAFDPSRLKLLERVVEEAWKELLRRSDVAAMNEERAKLTRELMAHRVMARALRGERDPQRLKEHALWGF